MLHNCTTARKKSHSSIIYCFVRRHLTRNKLPLVRAEQTRPRKTQDCAIKTPESVRRNRLPKPWFNDDINYYLRSNHKNHFFFAFKLIAFVNNRRRDGFGVAERSEVVNLIAIFASIVHLSAACVNVKLYARECKFALLTKSIIATFSPLRKLFLQLLLRWLLLRWTQQCCLRKLHDCFGMFEAFFCWHSAACSTLVAHQ